MDVVCSNDPFIGYRQTYSYLGRSGVLPDSPPANRTSGHNDHDTSCTSSSPLGCCSSGWLVSSLSPGDLMEVEEVEEEVEEEVVESQGSGKKWSEFVLSWGF